VKEGGYIKKVLRVCKLGFKGIPLSHKQVKEGGYIKKVLRVCKLGFKGIPLSHKQVKEGGPEVLASERDRTLVLMWPDYAGQGRFSSADCY